MSSFNPNEADIRQVMTDTGMEYIQARNHLISRYIVQQKVRRERMQPYQQTEQNIIDAANAAIAKAAGR